MPRGSNISEFWKGGCGIFYIFLGTEWGGGDLEYFAVTLPPNFFDTYYCQNIGIFISVERNHERLGKN